MKNGGILAIVVLAVAGLWLWSKQKAEAAPLAALPPPKPPTTPVTPPAAAPAPVVVAAKVQVESTPLTQSWGIAGTSVNPWTIYSAAPDRWGGQLQFLVSDTGELFWTSGLALE